MKTKYEHDRKIIELIEKCLKRKKEAILIFYDDIPITNLFIPFFTRINKGIQIRFSVVDCCYTFDICISQMNEETEILIE